MRPNCPQCKKQTPKKDGHILGRQRWKCKHCGYAYTKENTRHMDTDTPFKALQLYEAGWSSNRIGKQFGMSPTTVLKWVRLLSPANGRIHRKPRRAVYPPEVTEALRQMKNNRKVEADCKHYAELFWGREK